MKQTTAWLMSHHPLLIPLGVYATLFGVLFAEVPEQNHHDIMAWGIHGLAVVLVVYLVARQYLGHLVAASQGYTEWKKEHEEVKDELRRIQKYPPLAQWLAVVRADQGTQNAED